MNDFELEHLYNKNFKKIYRYFYIKFQSKEIAEDLTSDAFIKFLSIIKYKEDIYDPEKYLFGIVKLVFIEQLRKKYKGLKTIPIEKEQDFGGRMDEFLNDVDNAPSPIDIVISYIDKLPNKQAMILRLRLIEKLSLKEICLRLNRDMNYVKTTQKRAIKNLKLLISTFNVH